MFRSFRYCLWIVLPLAAEAAEVPPGGKEMLASPEVTAYAGRAAERGATVETVPVVGRSFATAQRLTLPQAPEHPWDAGARAKIQGPLTAGDAGLVTFEARALPLAGGKPEDAVAGGTVYLEAARPPQYPKAVQVSFQCGPEWRQLFLPFTASQDLADGEGTLVFHLGLGAQALEIGAVRVLNYGTAVKREDLPRTSVTYRGHSLDAAWRKAAAERIAKFRMAPLIVEVRDAAGQPVADAEVRVKQVRSAFGFGSAVTARWLCEEGADGDRYRAVVDACFSRVVFENDMKMEFWEKSLANEDRASFRWDRTQQAMAWLNERGIGIRGHYLSWAPWEPWSEILREEPDKIRERILTHIPRIAAAVGHRVIEWDAINHLAGWDRNIDTATGLDFYTEIMRTARAATDRPLWVNEDQVFRPGRQQEDYHTRIQKLIADGVAPDGIGNQAHFDESFLPGPEEMLANSDRFAALVPALQITEFDVMTNGDEALAADYLRDVLTVCYSHPAYTGFLLWGFWEGAHWKPETALWRKDWTEKPAAGVWRNLVNHEWATTATGRTGQDGQLLAAAHFGVYEIEIRTTEKTMTLRHDHRKDSGPLTVTLP